MDLGTDGSRSIIHFLRYTRSLLCLHDVHSKINQFSHCYLLNHIIYNWVVNYRFKFTEYSWEKDMTGVSRKGQRPKLIRLSAS